MGRAIRKVWQENSLSIVMFALFAVFFAGQTVTGWRTYDDEQQAHGRPPVTLAQYVRSGGFIEATFENWESEFLQMGGFVLLAELLRQRGSGESKKLPDERGPGEVEEVDEDPRRNARPDSPWPVHRGGLALALYSHSLTIALFGLFLFSLFMHALGGQRAFNEEAREHGQATVGFWGYFATSRFWFESLQNWQSEFLSVGVLIVLGIFLREKGSPESKPVHAPHRQTE